GPPPRAHPGLAHGSPRSPARGFAIPRVVPLVSGRRLRDGTGGHRVGGFCGDRRGAARRRAVGGGGARAHARPAHARRAARPDLDRDVPRPRRGDLRPGPVDLRPGPPGRGPGRRGRAPARSLAGCGRSRRPARRHARLDPRRAHPRAPTVGGRAGADGAHASAALERRSRGSRSATSHV
ncbi:MAG: hypothetical protein AVDCRST_MAG45-667, partial [uncultured Solirubrobacterales bacterium]